jgi:hypothetical protein
VVTSLGEEISRQSDPFIAGMAEWHAHEEAYGFALLTTYQPSPLSSRPIAPSFLQIFLS